MLPATTSPTMPAPASCTRRPSHGREDFDAWMDAAKLQARGIDPAIPFTVDDGGFFTKDAPGFGPDRRSARHRRQRQEGRRQRGGHRGADRTRRCSRAAVSSTAIRTAGVPRSRSSSATRRSGSSIWTRSSATARRLAQPRASGDRRHAFRARRRPEPPARHDRGPPRLGAVAPARLGRADCHLRRRRTAMC
jgi:hypothetical protein